MTYLTTKAATMPVEPSLSAWLTMWAEKTVKNDIWNLLAKLGMRRRSEAAAYAARIAERRRRPDQG